jgi:hypothetical protein
LLTPLLLLLLRLTSFLLLLLSLLLLLLRLTSLLLLLLLDWLRLTLGWRLLSTRALLHSFSLLLRACFICLSCRAATASSRRHRLT